jgi:hypothetical protein
MPSFLTLCIPKFEFSYYHMPISVSLIDFNSLAPSTALRCNYMIKMAPQSFYKFEWKTKWPKNHKLMILMVGCVNKSASEFSRGNNTTEENLLSMPFDHRLINFFWTARCQKLNCNQSSSVHQVASAFLRQVKCKFTNTSYSVNVMHQITSET